MSVLSAWLKYSENRIPIVVIVMVCLISPIKVESTFSTVDTNQISAYAAKMYISVVKRILDMTSPPILLKRKCFKKPAMNDAEAHTIINLSIEMGSSIEEGKHNNEQFRQ